MSAPVPIKLAPSILTCNFAHLADELKAIEQADSAHIDVMDGHFVPNISFGLPVLAAARQVSSLFMDVHLMIEQPERYLKDFAEAGADGLTIHSEATVHLHRAVHQIKELGKVAGVAINPATPLETLRPILPDVDLILLMSVNPGFSGQRFIMSTLERLKTLRTWLDYLDSPAELQVDGGVTAANVSALVEAGATNLVAGSAVFGPDGGEAGLARLREVVRAATTPS